MDEFFGSFFETSSELLGESSSEALSDSMSEGLSASSSLGSSEERRRKREPVEPVGRRRQKGQRSSAELTASDLRDIPR